MSDEQILDVIAEANSGNGPVGRRDALAILAALRDAGYEVVPADTARLGRAATEIKPCPPDHATEYWRGYAQGWTSARQWLYDVARAEARADAGVERP